MTSRRQGATMIARPLESQTDYVAAMDRLADLDDAESDDMEVDELTLLEALIEEYESREMEEEDRDDDEDYELISRFPEAETVPLATFNLSNGSEVRFLGIPVLGEIMIGEITDTGTEDLLVGPELHPVRLFQQLAPKASVPRMLARLDQYDLFADRTVVDALPDAIDVSLSNLGIESPTATAAVGAGSCQPGPAGAQYFASHHCNSGGGPGYGKSEKYCYSDSYGWIQKTSKKRMRATYTRMASCGSGTNRMRHFYKTASGYTTQVNLYSDPQKIVSWWSAKKGIRRYRRVRFEAHEAGGWVRGWVVYHDQIAGGWF